MSKPNPWEAWIKESGFALVYQGGNHNVYCNGKHHLRTAGGTSGWPVHPHFRWPMFSCDCAKWKAQ